MRFISLQPNEPHGFAVARMIRFKSPDIQILFVTGRIEPGLEGESILYKPVELSEFVAQDS
jgi:hypothetical protein